MMYDCGCNIVRCWGGNAYENDAFYDFCDEKGILVWQDFAMGCAVYLQDDFFCEKIQEEAAFIIKKLRQHPSLTLWAGDNEVDSFYGALGIRRDPNRNRLTREVLLRAVEDHDPARPYLPSSPFVDEKAFATGAPTSEEHLWGPRDYFKGDYYKNAKCHFASETGYHGCPAPTSLKKFITPEHYDNIGDSKECHDVEWLLHGAAYEPVFGAKDTYRNPLMVSQVERLFGSKPENMSTFALMSQISQAEAMKYFVERFRIKKWYTTGIIWWNIIDGWPQVSDAVVDWYGAKKLAYHYIKTSQTPFCIMCDEPDDNGDITVVAANDTRTDLRVTYTVTDLSTSKAVVQDTVTVVSDSTLRLASFKESAAFYRIDWSGDVVGTNHFVGKLGDMITLDSYMTLMQNMGYNKKLEGF
jgi:beta-mannosidase